MSFRIITDSASDIPQETAEKWGVTVMPIHTRFGEEEYLDGVTLKPEQFFEKLVKTDEIPRTSQITPYEFGQEFQKAVDAGESVLCITMSAGVSGTYHSACTAAAEYGSSVRVIDSRQFCISLYVLIQYACICRDKGMSMEETGDAIEKVKGRVHVISVFATLEYLRLGGRISSAAALAGNLLSIKPVITVRDGVVEVISRARGTKKALKMAVDFIRQVGGIDESMPRCLGFTGASEAVMTSFLSDHAAAYKDYVSGLTIVPVGATVGTYAGPGAVALAFFDNGE
ncbi:MAG: DegV family protein [Lachnospiraceae bacterium]|nr:DegV family protein [Lachnospiraceae bacterium]